MPNVLVVAYYFPPMGGAGVQRTLKFVKYLPENGWNPIILTVKNYHTNLRDSTLQAEIPPEATIHKTYAILLPRWIPWRIRNFIARWVLMVDEQLGWFPLTVHKGTQIIKLENISAIFTTSSPHSDHLIGYKLKRRTGLPWIADFRDPWLGNFAYNFPTKYHEQIAWKFEDLVCRNADRILVVSDPMRHALISRYRNLDPQKIIIIPNGYDPTDFANTSPSSENINKFVITYTGSFYRRVRKPDTFLAGILKAIENGQVHRRNIRIFFVGNHSHHVQEIIDRLKLNDIVFSTGYLPHKRSIAYLLEADLLLLIVDSRPGSDAVMTGKIFEYLATRKPILALAPHGVAADLVNEAQSGVIVAPQDIESIAAHVATFYYQWQRNELHINSKTEVIERYNRQKLTTRLAKLLNEITS